MCRVLNKHHAGASAGAIYPVAAAHSDGHETRALSHPATRAPRPCQGTLRSDDLDKGGPRARRAAVAQFRTTFF